MKGEQVSYTEELRALRAREAALPPRTYLSKEEFKKLKGALTKAKNSGDGRKVLAAVEQAVERFDDTTWPDNWATWRIALEDAASKARFKDDDSELADELHAASIILF
jgi:hypothetical protein